LNSSDIGEKWDYIETVHQLFIDFKKTYDSVRREDRKWIRWKFDTVQIFENDSSKSKLYFRGN
jgi:hypothetical protein